MKKFFLLTIAALLLVGLSVNDCIGQKTTKLTKKQLLVENNKLTKMLVGKTDSITSFKKSNQELKDENQKTLSNSLTVLDGYKKRIASQKEDSIKLQKENQRLEKDVAEAKKTIFGLVDQIDSLFVANEMAKKHGTVATVAQFQPKDTMTWVTYELKDSVWVKSDDGEKVKMPKKGEIGFSEDKTSAYVRESDFQTGDFEKQIEVLKAGGHQLKRVMQ